MRRRGRPRHPDILTPREREVLALLRDGLTDEQIGERLGIGKDGAQSHVSEILGKLRMEGREGAARWRPPERPFWEALPIIGWLWKDTKPAWLRWPSLLAAVGLLAVALGWIGLLAFDLLGDEEETLDDLLERVQKTMSETPFQMGEPSPPGTADAEFAVQALPPDVLYMSGTGEDGRGSLVVGDVTYHSRNGLRWTTSLDATFFATARLNDPRIFLRHVVEAQDLGEGERDGEVLRVAEVTIDDNAILRESLGPLWDYKRFTIAVETGSGEICDDTGLLETLDEGSINDVGYRVLAGPGYECPGFFGDDRYVYLWGSQVILTISTDEYDDELQQELQTIVRALGVDPGVVDDAEVSAYPLFTVDDEPWPELRIRLWIEPEEALIRHVRFMTPMGHDQDDVRGFDLGYEPIMEIDPPVPGDVLVFDPPFAADVLACEPMGQDQDYKPTTGIEPLVPGDVLVCAPKGENHEGVRDFDVRYEPIMEIEPPASDDVMLSVAAEALWEIARAGLDTINSALSQYCVVHDGLFPERADLETLAEALDGRGYVWPENPFEERPTRKSAEFSPGDFNYEVSADRRSYTWEGYGWDTSEGPREVRCWPYLWRGPGILQTALNQYCAAHDGLFPERADPQTLAQTLDELGYAWPENPFEERPMRSSAEFSPGDFNYEVSSDRRTYTWEWYGWDTSEGPRELRCWPNLLW